MWKDRRLLDLFGISHPIIQAPMAGASTPEMAAAAANAGCLGSLGCALMNEAGYRTHFEAARAQTNGALNVNFFCHEQPVNDDEKNKAAKKRLQAYYEEFNLGELPDAVATSAPFGDEMAKAVLDTAPNIVSFHFGLPDLGLVKQLKSRGIKVLSSATTVEEARFLERNGADAIIAQGWEAGGHHGFFLEKDTAAIGTFALVPQLVDAVEVPIIAAGGIADGRGIAASLALGAAGAQIGTAFLTTQESSVPVVHQQSLLQSDGSDTALTKVFSGRPARGIKNRYMTDLAHIEDDLPDFPIMNTLSGPLRKASAATGSPDMVAQWSGQAVGLNRKTTTKELIDRLVSETENVLAAF